MITPLQFRSGLSCQILLCALLAFAIGGTARAQAPVILTHPVTQAIAPGGSVTLSVTASGGGPLAYQ